MLASPIVTYILLGLNIAFSLYGFSNPQIIQRYLLNVGAVLSGKQWERMFTSAFLHGDLMHLAFNMLALWSVGRVIEAHPQVGLGPGKYLILYVGSLLFGNFLALLAHHRHPYYSALGASGAVSGIIFSFVLLAPSAWLTFFFIPMPAWVFGLVYIAFSIWGVRSRAGNIGHEAHMGGALGGMIIYLIFKPYLLFANPLLVAGLVLPILGLAVAIYFKPEWFKSPLDRGTSRPFKVVEPEKRSWRKDSDKVTADRNPVSELQQELDSYLEKVRKFGYDGLSKEEKDRLNKLSELLGKK